MGCENSKQIDKQLGNDQQKIRKNKKNGDVIYGRASVSTTITENVTMDQQRISREDGIRVSGIINPHFFFSSFTAAERSEIIDKMVVYRCEKNKYIFKQNDPGTLFFIIKEGQVSIQINNRLVKFLEKDDCFGQLSLLYTAPRSASVKAVTDCVFWGLHQSVFKLYTEQSVRKNYKIAKPFLQKIPLFQFLSANQINSVAYAMYTLKYKPFEVIFKQKDDANSFYIVTQGSVSITIKGKEPVIIKKGESFGENSFRKNEVRSGTATSGPSGAKLLSIGREDLVKCLGSSIQELTQYNIVKWALKRSKIFGNISNEMIRRFIKITQSKPFQDNQVIVSKGQVLKHLLVSIEGKIDETDAGVLVNEQYLLPSKYGSTQILIQSNIKKIGDGMVYFLPIEKIQAILKLSLAQTLSSKQDIFKNCNTEKSFGTSKKGISSSKIKTNFDSLVFQRKIGEGQFGNVLLVRDKETNQKFALKCIKKKLIIEQGLQALVKSQKQTMLMLDHPFIVSLHQTFKDEAFIYFLMSFIDGADFFDLLRQIGLCNHLVSTFYTATLILCLEQLHSRNVVYRDLKPENAVIDKNGYMYMIDLGTAKVLTEEKGYRTFTIIGTPHYMAPEILEGKGYGIQVDLWSLGVMLYEMVCGKLPFGEDLEDPYSIYKQIMHGKIKYPTFYYSRKGQNFIEKLMDKNPRRRHVQDFAALKNDPFFEGFKWQELECKTLKPPVAPKKHKPHMEKLKQMQGEVLVSSYLAKQIKSAAVTNVETPWDINF